MNIGTSALSFWRPDTLLERVVLESIITIKRQQHDRQRKHLCSAIKSDDWKAPGVKGGNPVERSRGTTSISGRDTPDKGRYDPP